MKYWKKNYPDLLENILSRFSPFSVRVKTSWKILLYLSDPKVFSNFETVAKSSPKSLQLILKHEDVKEYLRCLQGNPQVFAQLPHQKLLNIVESRRAMDYLKLLGKSSENIQLIVALNDDVFKGVLSLNAGSEYDDRIMRVTLSILKLPHGSTILKKMVIEPLLKEILVDSSKSESFLLFLARVRAAVATPLQNSGQSSAFLKIILNYASDPSQILKLGENEFLALINFANEHSDAFNRCNKLVLTVPELLKEPGTLIFVRNYS